MGIADPETNVHRFQHRVERASILIVTMFASESLYCRFVVKEDVMGWLVQRGQCENLSTVYHGPGINLHSHNHLEFQQRPCWTFSVIVGEKLVVNKMAMMSLSFRLI